MNDTLAPLPGAQQDQLAPTPSSQTGIATGAVLPIDLRIKLVRADSSIWDMFLSILFSITLTLFGVFLGACLTKEGSNPVQQITPLERTAMWFFGGISGVLIAAWGLIKYFQLRKGYTVSMDKLN